MATAQSSCLPFLFIRRYKSTTVTATNPLLALPLHVQNTPGQFLTTVIFRAGTVKFGTVKPGTVKLGTVNSTFARTVTGQTRALESSQYNAISTTTV
jgi:hypothetical protein